MGSFPFAREEERTVIKVEIAQKLQSPPGQAIDDTGIQ
jgi:hypothetical protein